MSLYLHCPAGSGGDLQRTAVNVKLTTGVRGAVSLQRGARSKMVRSWSHRLAPDSHDSLLRDLDHVPARPPKLCSRLHTDNNSIVGRRFGSLIYCCC